VKCAWIECRALTCLSASSFYSGVYCDRICLSIIHSLLAQILKGANGYGFEERPYTPVPIADAEMAGGNRRRAAAAAVAERSDCRPLMPIKGLQYWSIHCGAALHDASRLFGAAQTPATFDRSFILQLSRA
jgi:hypothetical protein